MNGIYLTEEGKKEIEAKIDELEYIFQQTGERFDSRDSGTYHLLKEILSSATILPVEDSYEVDNVTIIEKRWMFKNYPNGVIIQPK